MPPYIMAAQNREKNMKNTVSLREATMQDFQFYFELKCGASDIYWQGFTSKPEREVLERCFNSRIGRLENAQVGSKLIYIISEQQEQQSISVGYIQFTLEENAIEIGISVNEKMQGQGIGKAAARCALELALFWNKNVYVRVRDDNIASWTCFMHAGFVRSEEYELVEYPGAGRVPF